jgi:hypothetical protein
MRGGVLHEKYISSASGFFTTIALVAYRSTPTTTTRINLSTVPSRTDSAVLDVYIPGTYTWD